MAKRFDVIVLGLGAMGACAAWRLAGRGASVLGLEQFRIGHAMGSSHGESRMIRLAYYEHPDYVPLLRRAYGLWREMERESGEALLHITGGLYMGREESDLIAGSRRAAEAHDIAHRILSRGELAREFPQFELPGEFVGMLEEQAGFLLCEKVIAAACGLARGAGAELHEEEEAAQWEETAQGVRVATGRGEYEARALVICGGAWSGKLLPGTAELVVTRQTLGWTRPERPERFARGAAPVWAIGLEDEALFYGFPMNEAGLVKVARHGAGPTTDVQRVARGKQAGDEEEIEALARRWAPDLAGPVEAMKVCLYTNSPDHHFIIDKAPGCERVHFAAGFSGHGFKFASVVGEVMADLALAGKTDLPAAFLGLARLGGKG